MYSYVSVSFSLRRCLIYAAGIHTTLYLLSLYYYAISLISVPASLRDVLRGVCLSEEDVAGGLAEAGMLGDEAEVAEVGRVEAAEGHVPKAVEVVLRGRAVVATAPALLK